MNILLLTILAFSGAIELVVGVWALMAPTSFASMWLEIPQLSAAGQFRGPIEVLLFVIGWAGLAMAALHLLAFAWLRSEKREAYRLSIALGGALTVLGLAIFIFGRFGEPPLARSLYALFLDGLRGAILGLVGVLAMNAPATVRELRLPARHEPDRLQRSRSDSMRDHRRGGDRDEGRSRDRGPARGRDRDGERRGPPGGRDGRRGEPGREGRGSRGGRDGSRSQRGPGGDRRDRPSDPVAPNAPAARDAGPEKTAVPGPLQARPLPVRDEGDADRWQQGRRRPGAPPETEDVRSLGVVVTGRPPQSIAREPEGARPVRHEGGASVDERPALPRAPMVPRVRSDVSPARPLRPDAPAAEGEHPIGERDRDRDRDRDRRPRRRRRSASGRSSGDDRMRHGSDRGPDDAGRSPEPLVDRFEEEDRPVQVDRYVPTERHAVPPPERYAPTESDEPADRFMPHDRFVASEPPAPAERRVSYDRPAPPPPPPIVPADRAPRESREEAGEIGPTDEPLDMLSVFGEREESGSAPTQPTGFGRHRRPFTQHRKGRQSKPRDSKIRHGLGSELAREQDAANPPAQPFGRPGPSEERKGEGRAGLSGGIGPVDLDEGESENLGSDES